MEARLSSWSVSGTNHTEARISRNDEWTDTFCSICDAPGPLWSFMTVMSNSRLDKYYARTAGSYDTTHVRSNDEHSVALLRTLPFLRDMKISSILDVGCGTGRSLRWYSEHIPDASLTGIDRSPDLLELAREYLPNAVLQQGKAESLPFEDDVFDMVCATGMLHHVSDPDQCIKEMFRVSRLAVLISDHNNFAFGHDLTRRTRLLLFACGLLTAATFVKQGFRTQGYTEADGYWYSFSLLNRYRLISSLSKELAIFPTRPVNEGKLGNMLLSQSHLAIWAITK